MFIVNVWLVWRGKGPLTFHYSRTILMQWEAAIAYDRLLSWIPFPRPKLTKLLEMEGAEE